jgi:hypothetical protein
MGRDGGGYRTDLGKRGTEIFLQRGLDYPNQWREAVQRKVGLGSDVPIKPRADHSRYSLKLVLTGMN